MSDHQAVKAEATEDRQLDPALLSSPPLSQHSGPSMSDGNAAQTRQQPNSYPSPHSYPSPSLQPTYTYPPPSQQGEVKPEAYRASPTGSNMALPSLSLPPIRAMDGQAQPQQQQAVPQPQMGSPLPPSVAPMSAYYPPAGQPMSYAGQQMNVTSSPQNVAMRYALPQQGVLGERIMSGGRHKKEIKRRTKTGCLTCRKRRIKCDEAHPTCRNCQKSKRECLGYDPIFKPTIGPAQIQPAPSVASQSASVPATAPPPAIAYSNIPQGYAPAASAGYAPGIAACIPPSAPSTDSAYEYSAIDPALAGADSNGMSIPPPPYNSSHALGHDLKSGLGGAGPYPPAPSEGQNPRVRPINVEDTFTLYGFPCPQVPESDAPISPSMIEEIHILYAKDYAPGIDKFLECSWYTTEGWGQLTKDTRLLEMFAYLIERFKSVPSDDYNGMQATRSLEAKLLWNTFCLCRTSPKANGAESKTGVKTEAELKAETETKAETGAGVGEQDLKEAQARLDIVESILTAQIREGNVALQVSYSEHLPPPKHYEVEFWRNAGQFVAGRPDEPASAKEMDAALVACRHTLGMLENRDVLYSMMVARHIGVRFSDWPDGVTQAYNNDDADDRTKLVVAKRFIEDEAGHGMTQVCQRLCDMAIASWKLLR